MALHHQSGDAPTNAKVTYWRPDISGGKSAHINLSALWPGEYPLKGEPSSSDRNGPEAYSSMEGGPGAGESSSISILPLPHQRRQWDTRRRKRQAVGRPAPTDLFAQWRSRPGHVPETVVHSSDSIHEEETI